MIEILVGIDDTDNKETRGTGFRSRQLAGLFVQENYQVLDILRHQLFVHPDIPFTSQNSSACLHILADDLDKVIRISRNFLNEIAAPGSDVGLCVLKSDDVTAEIIEWGLNAKKIVLNKQDALDLASKNQIFLEGLTGTHDGIIGALAAVGLRKWGNDGRCIWLRGIEIRDIKGIYKIADLKKLVAVEEIYTVNEIPVDENDYINIHDWFRPVIIDGKIIAFVESEKNNNNEWKVVSKEYIKSISN